MEGGKVWLERAKEVLDVIFYTERGVIDLYTIYKCWIHVFNRIKNDGFEYDDGNGSINSNVYDGDGESLNGGSGNDGGWARRHTE